MLNVSGINIPTERFGFTRLNKNKDKSICINIEEINICKRIGTLERVWKQSNHG